MEKLPGRYNVPISGVSLELTGVMSRMVIWVTEKARRTVMEREIFSPQLAGSQNTPSATSMMRRVGAMILRT